MNGKLLIYMRVNKESRTSEPNSQTLTRFDINNVLVL